MSENDPPADTDAPPPEPDPEPQDPGDPGLIVHTQISEGDAGDPGTIIHEGIAPDGESDRFQREGGD